MIKSPNFTQIPNDYFMYIMKTLSGNENLIFLAIMRNTFGWQKKKDKISYTQFIEMTGIGSNTTIKKSIESLLEKGLIFAESDGKGKSITYSVNVDTSTETVDDKKPDHYSGCRGTSTETVEGNKKTTTETVDTKESNINKLSKEIYIEIENAYLESFKIAVPNGTPFIDYVKVRSRIKALLKTITKEKLLLVIDRAKTDEWNIKNGFSFIGLLSDYQINKLLNGSPQGKPSYSKPDLKVNQRTQFLDLEE